MRSKLILKISMCFVLCFMMMGRPVFAKANTSVSFNDQNELIFDEKVFRVTGRQESNFVKTYYDGGKIKGSGKIEKNTLLGSVKIAGVILTSKEKIKVKEVGVDFNKYAYYQKLAFEVTVQIAPLSNKNFTSLFRAAQIGTNAQAYNIEWRRDGNTNYTSTVYLMRNKSATPVQGQPGSYVTENGMEYSSSLSGSSSSGEKVSLESGNVGSLTSSTKTSYKTNVIEITANAGGDDGDAIWTHRVDTSKDPTGEVGEYMRSEKHITGILSWHLPAETYSLSANPQIRLGYQPNAILKASPYNTFLTNYTLGVKVYFGLARGTMFVQRKEATYENDKRNAAIGEAVIIVN